MLTYLPQVIQLCAHSLSCVQLFAAPWTVGHQAPLSMEFSKQEYWSGLLHPTSGVLPQPGIEPLSTVSPELASGFSYHWCPLGSPKLRSYWNYLTAS